MAIEEPIELVRRFCAAWSDRDIDALVGYFTDDAVYHNIPIEPVTGRDAIRASIEGFMTGVERIEFQVHHIAADGPVVLTERVDVFAFADVTVKLPVMGIFEVTGGGISAWRDYFDMNQFMSQLPTG